MAAAERGELTGRRALVTGGGRGIGRGISLELAAAGADVVVNFRRDEEAAEEVAAEVRAAGGRGVALQGSIGELEEVEAMATRAIEELRGIDLLVLNAGIASRGDDIAATDPGELQRVVATHALGAHRLTQLLLPAMREAPRGDVIAISSSELAAMRARGAPYNMAKAALEAMVLTLAHEEARNGIRANIVAPGLVVTDMGSRLVKAKLGLDDISELDSGQPFGRLCRPADIGRAVRFLASPGAAMATGQRLVLDGGADASPTG